MYDWWFDVPPGVVSGRVCAWASTAGIGGRPSIWVGGETGVIGIPLIPVCFASPL